MKKSMDKFKKSCQLDIPVSICYLLQNLGDAINLAVLGHQTHLSTQEALQSFLALGLAQMAIQILANPIVQGLNDSTEMLFGLPNQPGRSKERCSMRLNQGRMLHILFFVPVAALLVKCDYLLALCGQNSKVAAEAQKYIYFNLVALFLQGLADLQMRYMRSIDAKKVTVISNGLALVLHYFACRLFVL